MSDARATLQLRHEPGIATAEEGVVLLDGRNGLAITLTPAAAARTGQNLIDAAALAAGQRPMLCADAPTGRRDG